MSIFTCSQVIGELWRRGRCENRKRTNETVKSNLFKLWSFMHTVSYMVRYKFQGTEGRWQTIKQMRSVAESVGQHQSSFSALCVRLVDRPFSPPRPSEAKLEPSVQHIGNRGREWQTDVGVSNPWVLILRCDLFFRFLSCAHQMSIKCRRLSSIQCSGPLAHPSLATFLPPPLPLTLLNMFSSVKPRIENGSRKPLP